MQHFYFGCFLMMVGLYLSFFMSHRRVWIYKDTTARAESIRLAGAANKNKLAFEKEFALLADHIRQSIQ